MMLDILNKKKQHPFATDKIDFRYFASNTSNKNMCSFHANDVNKCFSMERGYVQTSKEIRIHTFHMIIIFCLSFSNDDYSY